MAPLLHQLYQRVFRRSSTFALTCVVGAVFFERAFGQLTETIWKRQNRGKLYSDVRAKWDAIAAAGDDEDDDDE